MTKKALLYLGYSRDVAKRIAHYSSTYADHPDNEILIYNKIMLSVFTFDSYDDLDFNKAKYGSYDLEHSQSDEDIHMVSIHAMRAWFENIDESEAVKRALYGGTYEDVNGECVTIIGAYQVIKSLEGKKIEDYTVDEQKALGVALHTIQDAESHKGKRWVKKNKEKAEAMGHKNEHPDLAEQGIAKNSSKALVNTIKAIRKLKNSSKKEK